MKKLIGMLLAVGTLWAAEPPVVYVKAGKLLDVRTGMMLVNQGIVIRGDRIEKIGNAAQVTAPAGAKVVDLSQSTCCPV